MLKFIRTVLPLIAFTSGCTFAADANIQEGIAIKYPNDAGISKNPNVIFSSSFEDGIVAPLEIKRNGVSAVNDPKLAFYGAQCAQITATKDVDEGGDLTIAWDEGINECYMRVYVRFEKGTQMPHHFINLSAFNNTYKYRWGGSAGILPPGGQDGKVSTTLEPPKYEGDEWHFYSYWHHMHSWQTWEGKPDGRDNPYYGNTFSMEGSPRINEDEWICLELMIKLNDIGQNNGEQAFWINGKKIGHWKTGSPEGSWVRNNFNTFGKYNKDPKPFEGFNWRSDESLKINHATLQWYLSKDQSWSKMTVDKNTVYFDNLVIAKSYIGPLHQ